MFDIITATLSGPVANGETIEFALPDGRTAASYVAAAGAKLWIESHETMIPQDESEEAAAYFTLAYDTEITLTYEGATTIPAGSVVKLQVPLAFLPATATVLTMSANVAGATANNEIQDSSAQLSQAEYRVFAKTIAQKINALVADVESLRAQVKELTNKNVITS